MYKDSLWIMTKSSRNYVHKSLRNLKIILNKLIKCFFVVLARPYGQAGAVSEIKQEQSFE